MDTLPLPMVLNRLHWDEDVSTPWKEVFLHTHNTLFVINECIVLKLDKKQSVMAKREIEAFNRTEDREMCPPDQGFFFLLFLGGRSA
ncbi:hypothetical protein J4Q44_G00280160 [Coregonus suidteri]|uniref:Uncharacterized protein n=1 Tax=Coregonus suidteri TaxID=861788 RepID=A0AAN8L1Q3_9TELE